VLAFEPTEPGTMRRPPRRPDQPILTGEVMWRIVFVSFLFVFGAFGMFYWAQSRSLPVEEGRTLVVNTIVVIGIFYLFSVRYVHGTSLSWQGVLGTPAVLIGVAVAVVLQLALTYLPFMGAIFDTRPVALIDGLVVIGVGVAMLFLLEAEKGARTVIATALKGGKPVLGKIVLKQ
jgi:magnesium-transporting ATPase (P-type)